MAVYSSKGKQAGVCVRNSGWSFLAHLTAEGREESWMRREIPEIDGWTHPDFHCVAETLRRIIGQYGGGAAVCVFHQGECVADLWGGLRDDRGTPWVEDTMAPSFSTTARIAVRGRRVPWRASWSRSPPAR